MRRRFCHFSAAAPPRARPAIRRRFLSRSDDKRARRPPRPPAPSYLCGRRDAHAGSVSGNRPGLGRARPGACGRRPGLSQQMTITYLDVKISRARALSDHSALFRFFSPLAILPPGLVSFRRPITSHLLLLDVFLLRLPTCRNVVFSTPSKPLPHGRAGPSRRPRNFDCENVVEDKTKKNAEKC